MSANPVEYRFEPVLSPGDWFALLVPVALAIFIFFFALRLVRRKQNSVGLKIAASAIATALIFVAAAHLPRLTTLTFRGKEMRSSLFAFERKYYLDDPNHVRMKRGAIELWTPEGTITLPMKASWRAEDLQVDASFLANEFAGRSGIRN